MLEPKGELLFLIFQSTVAKNAICGLNVSPMLQMSSKNCMFCTVEKEAHKAGLLTHLQHGCNISRVTHGNVKKKYKIPIVGFPKGCKFSSTDPLKVVQHCRKVHPRAVRKNGVEYGHNVIVRKCLIRSAALYTSPVRFNIVKTVRTYNLRRALNLKCHKKV